MSPARGTRAVWASLALTLLAMALALVVVLHFYFTGNGNPSAGLCTAYALAAGVHGGLSGLAVVCGVLGMGRARRAGSEPTARMGLIGALVGGFGLTITAVLVGIWWMESASYALTL